MNVQKLVLSLFASLLLAAAAPGQQTELGSPKTDSAAKTDASKTDSASKTESGETADPEVIKIYLMDGSVVTGKLSIKDLEVETQFGKLTVPVTEVRSFTPGLASHPELGKRVFDLIDKLGSTDFDEREQSQKELVKLGNSVRKELEKHLQDPDNERRMRVKNILAELEEEKDDDESDAAANSADKGPLIQHDTVETSQFTVVGKIVSRSFTVASLYGPLNVKLSDIKLGQHEVGKKPGARKTMTIDAANFVQRAYKDSGVRVERGDRVTVTADGQLSMTPWGPGQVSTPDGNPNFGWYMPNTIASGCLVGAIGNSDTPFKVGTSINFKATKAGMLRFAIAMQHDNAHQAFPGKYTLKIKVDRN